ncbi:hypothetical protein NKG94_02035 [Micromonospora sp. M12]
MGDRPGSLVPVGGIYHRNVDAVRFYSRRGYTRAGLLLGKSVTRSGWPAMPMCC